MAKRMFIMLLGLGFLFGAILAYKLFGNYMMKKYLAQHANPPVIVSTMKVNYQPWEKILKTSGSLRATQGVDVTAEVSGIIRNIYFDSGIEVKENTLLVELNDETEKAQLKVLEASKALAQKTYERDKAQFAINAISKQILENDLANLQSLEAQVLEQKTLINKKIVRAPFSGHLGISEVDLGQYINAGDKMVTLQMLDPILVDFYLPQQDLVQIRVNQEVILTTDIYADQKFVGKITTIDPKVDPATRNIQIEATVPNKEHLLLPGMFVTVQVKTGIKNRYLTVPQTAISFNPYGEVVYTITQDKNAKDDEKPALLANQAFVTVGETRGDQIAVLEGLKENDTVVIAGQLKLKNGSRVEVNNKILPENDPAPKVTND